jgi:hypothetical protein
MKSIIVIDTPKSCSECELAYDVSVGGSLINWRCPKVEGYFHTTQEEYKKRRPTQCPLQDTTELLEALEEMFGIIEHCHNEEDLTVNIDLEEVVDNFNKLKQAFGGNDEN